MAEFALGGVVTPQGGAGMANSGGIKSDAFADAVQRARMVAAKIGVEASTGPPANTFPFVAQKRPMVEDADGPECKKFAAKNDPIGAQLAAMVAQQSRSQVTEEFKVPDRMVGLIIGRGGENISKLQNESGCKIQISPDSGGKPERPCSLTGTPEAIRDAKRLIEQIIERARDGPGSQGDHNNNGGGGGGGELMIPAGKVGLVIGKGGETIKHLQERAGVRMIMIQDGPMPTGVDKPLRIMGEPYKVQ
uniref:K Homology domain-containing protein n=1 Tax=Petromyzon marinus TaxID=7757 RepID=S4R9C3_PETMA